MQSDVKILYIDDEYDNLVVFRSTFRSEYNVLTAVSANEGLEILKKHRDIQLVITDQRMPEVSGVEFLQTIIEQFPDPIRIILTGYTDVNDIVKAINHGRIYHYATKPWDKASLKIIIEKALEYYSLKKANTDLIESLRIKNKKLTDAIDELEMFLYRSSHDLRGPISTQLGLIYLTKLETDLLKITQYIEKMELSVLTMDKTLSKLTKINVANLDLIHSEEVDVIALVKETLGINEDAIKSKNIATTVTGAPSHSTINTNPELLKIVLENIIENAIAYSKGASFNPNINISISQKSTDMLICISDNGSGIDKKIIDRIFDPFYRGNENARGNGLGLYMVTKALAKLNGKISVNSTLNEGSTFTISIPSQQVVSATVLSGAVA